MESFSLQFEGFSLLWCSHSQDLQTRTKIFEGGVGEAQTGGLGLWFWNGETEGNILSESLVNFNIIITDIPHNLLLTDTFLHHLVYF